MGFIANQVQQRLESRGGDAVSPKYISEYGDNAKEALSIKRGMTARTIENVSTMLGAGGVAFGITEGLSNNLTASAFVGAIAMVVVMVKHEGDDETSYHIPFHQLQELRTQEPNNPELG